MAAHYKPTDSDEIIRQHINSMPSDRTAPPTGAETRPPESAAPSGAQTPTRCEKCGEDHPARWNCITTKRGVQVCRGLHEKNAGCEWEPWPPPPRSVSRDEVLAALSAPAAPVPAAHHCADPARCTVCSPTMGVRVPAAAPDPTPRIGRWRLSEYREGTWVDVAKGTGSKALLAAVRTVALVPDAAPPDAAMTDYGITHGELRERIEAVQRGEVVSHDEAMQRVRGGAAPEPTPCMSGLSCPECETEMVSEAGDVRRCPECGTTVTPAAASPGEAPSAPLGDILETLDSHLHNVGVCVGQLRTAIAASRRKTADLRGMLTSAAAARAAAERERDALRESNAGLQALLAAEVKDSGAAESAMEAAVMDAIEQTVIVCDTHEKEGVPMEARVVDYAGILANAKAAALRATPRTGQEGQDNG